MLAGVQMEKGPEDRFVSHVMEVGGNGVYALRNTAGKKGVTWVRPDPAITLELQQLVVRW